ncbi:hypothetical protein [Bacillus sp. FJAT-22090]|uniref:hypothetical protein n=1 Tax=Bacillus sp. FJAT-22090 TaxID=1581038 RepID=UPI0011A533DC|nr:hypothetical protein [Bacillus sp. FJAT-22090]
MLLEIKKRLKSFGLSATMEDDYVLTFIIEKVTNHIKTQTNLMNIPVPLHHIAIDMVVGEFLMMKKSMGQLTIDGIDFGLVAKTVQDGDTTTTFAIDKDNMTPEASFNAFINYLRHDTFNFIAYRVLTW